MLIVSENGDYDELEIKRQKMQRWLLFMSKEIYDDASGVGLIIIILKCHC